MLVCNIAIPGDAANWTRLNSLLLRNNKIKLLAGGLLRHWVNLEKLALGSNNITTIPEDIGSCVQLKELDVS